MTNAAIPPVRKPNVKASEITIGAHEGYNVFHEIDHMAPNIQFAIPGCRSEAQANPESGNPQQRLRDSGFSIIGLRPMISLRTTHMIRISGATPASRLWDEGASPPSGDRAEGGNGVGESG
jgi:hypothetical protein